MKAPDLRECRAIVSNMMGAAIEADASMSVDRAAAFLHRELLAMERGEDEAARAEQPFSETIPGEPHDNLWDRVPDGYQAVLRRAARITAERGGERGSVWERSGMRGQTVMAFSKAERAMNEVMAGRVPNEDHFLDLINYAAFALVLLYRAEERGSSGPTVTELLNGGWPWEGK